MPLQWRNHFWQSLKKVPESDLSEISGAVLKSWWPSWVPPRYGLCGRKSNIDLNLIVVTELRSCVKVVVLQSSGAV